MDREQINQLRNTLRNHGGAHLVGADGKRVFLALNRIVGVEENGIMLAREGGGCFFHTLDRPVNRFRLTAAGFPLTIADGLSEIVNTLLTPDEEPALKQIEQDTL